MCIGYGRVLRSAPAYPTCSDGSTAFRGYVAAARGGSGGDIANVIRGHGRKDGIDRHGNAGCVRTSVVVGTGYRITGGIIRCNRNAGLRTACTPPIERRT